MYVARSVFFVFLFFTFALNGMNFNQFPQEIIGNTIMQLVTTIGTPVLEKQNKQDIPIIAKYIKALSLTNKHTYNMINAPYCSQILLDALAERFGDSQLEIAAQVKTPGVHEWLKDYLNKSGEYEQFKVIQRIFEIDNPMRREFAEFGVQIEDAQKFGRINIIKQKKFLLL